MNPYAKFLAGEEEYNQRIGNAIKTARVMNGKSLLSMADMLNVTHQQYHKYELGVNRISSFRLCLIARELGVPIADLLENNFGFLIGHRPYVQKLNLLKMINTLDTSEIKIIGDFIGLLMRRK